MLETMGPRKKVVNARLAFVFTNRKQEWKVESIRSPVFSKVYWQIRGIHIYIYVCTYIHMYI